MKKTLKRILHPVRQLAGRFVILPGSSVGAVASDVDTDSIIFKVAHIIAADKIEGDYLEFGVYAGASFIHSYKAIRQVFELFGVPQEAIRQKDAIDRMILWDRMRFFAFDSFQGLPALMGPDTQTRDFAEGQYACSEDIFRQNLTRAGVPLERVVAIPGWFAHTCTGESIAKYSMRKAAIIHVDCDLYESAKTVLDFVTPLLTDGTIVIFDDWYCYRGNPNLGEQRAFSEWRGLHPDWIVTDFQKEGPWRNSFILNRR